MMPQYLIFPLTGLLVAVIKILIEYDRYKDRVKSNNTTKGLGFASLFCLSVFFYVITENNIVLVSVFLLSYWNVYQILRNYFHNENIFYVGKDALLDKILRRLFKYESRAKFVLHIITVITIVILSIYNG